MTTYPTIHTNGSGKNALEHDYRNALAKLNDAIRSFESIEFNARDYYPQGPYAFTIARNERTHFFGQLVAVRTYLEGNVEHISDSA